MYHTRDWIPNGRGANIVDGPASVTRAGGCHTGARVAGQENSTLTPRDEDEGLGAGFFLKIAALCVACGIIGLILFLIWSRAVYAWGFFGGFLAFGAVLCLFAWLYDRRHART
jgi:hypothetical protein